MHSDQTVAESPAVASVATSLPPHRVDQSQARRAIGALWDAHQVDYDPEWVDHFFGAVGVDYRHLALPPAAYLDIDSFGAANDQYVAAATELGSRALEAALERAELGADEVDAIFFTTVTGVASPSVDANIINEVGLPRRIRRTPMFGLGCVGGAAGLGRLADYLRGQPDGVAVLVAVELCSLTVERHDTSMADYIGAALFADGAAAVVGVGADRIGNHSGARITATHSAFYRDTEWVMGWDIDQHGFGLVLSGELPEVIETELGREVDGFLDSQKLGRADIATWISHPGGPKVIEAIEQALALDGGELETAWESLRQVGNLSSASVLHVLETTMSGDQLEFPALLLAMGPGFSTELVLLE